MKKLFVLFVLASAGIISCKSSDGDKAAEATVKSESPAPLVVVSGGEPVHLTKQQFIDQVFDYEKNPQAWVYKGKLPGLVDFYADWCRPCKITSPILDELAQEYAGKIVIYKVNVDEERELASVFGVQSIPTFLFMPMEGKPSLSSGIAQTPEETKAMFRSQIESVLLAE